jgi:hypothetical protein
MLKLYFSCLQKQPINKEVKSAERFPSVSVPWFHPVATGHSQTVHALLAGQNVSSSSKANKELTHNKAVYKT